MVIRFGYTNYTLIIKFVKQQWWRQQTAKRRISITGTISNQNRSPDFKPETARQPSNLHVFQYWLVTIFQSTQLNYGPLQWSSALARLAATPQVTGSRPTFGVCSEISFSSRWSPGSGTMGRETVCVTLREFTVPCNARGDNWWKIVA